MQTQTTEINHEAQEPVCEIAQTEELALQLTEIERQAYEANANNARLVSYYVKRIAHEQKHKRTYRLPLKHAHLFPSGQVIGG